MAFVLRQIVLVMSPIQHTPLFGGQVECVREALEHLIADFRTKPCQRKAATDRKLD